MELSKIAQELSLHFGKNILVYPDCKNVPVTCSFAGLDLEKSIELVSWSAGVEYYEKDGVYFLGGGKDYIEVLDNTNIDKAIEGVFGNSVRVIEDKIIVTGSEREVKRISKAIQTMQSREAVTVRIRGYEVTDDKMIELGIDIDKALEYSFSWEGLIQHSYNPIQNLVMSFNASLEMDTTTDDLRLVLDTLVTSISGKQQTITVGEAIDRKLYSVNEYGTSFVSGYSTLQTGYILKTTAYRHGEDWLFSVNLENSVEQTELRRNRMAMNNTVIIKSDSPSLIGRIIKDSEMVSVSKGIPFLSDIPYIGYLFRVTTERKITRNVLFFMERVAESSGESANGAQAPDCALPERLAIPLIDASTFVENLPIPK